MRSFLIRWAYKLDEGLKITVTSAEMGSCKLRNWRLVKILNDIMVLLDHPVNDLHHLAIFP